MKNVRNKRRDIKLEGQSVRDKGQKERRREEEVAFQAHCGFAQLAGRLQSGQSSSKWAATRHGVAKFGVVPSS